MHVHPLLFARDGERDAPRGGFYGVASLSRAARNKSVKGTRELAPANETLSVESHLSNTFGL